MQDIVVYIAGPYTHDDPVANTHTATKLHLDLLEAGIPSICPHLSLFPHFMRPQPYETWLAMDLVLIEKCCDAVIRIPGASSGADLEVALAHKLGLDVHEIDPNNPNEVSGLIDRLKKATSRIEVAV